MYRLTGSDASFLYQETPTAPMHTLKIFLVDLAPGQPLNSAGISRRMEAMVGSLPMLRQRALYVPFGLNHPVMVEDPDFDLDYHLCRVGLPEPGGMQELEEMIALVAGHPLDQHRPLWEFWVIDGLEDGRVACVLKIHHALADGMASVRYMNRLWNDGTMADNGEISSWTPEDMPSGRRLVWDALVDRVRDDIRGLPAFIRTVYRGKRDLLAHARTHPSPTVAGMQGEMPRCRWNYALSQKRSFATARLPLAVLRDLKARIGGTLNDAVLGLCATSLRNFLLGHNELPDQPLVAAIPVGTDEAGEERESGNRVTTITTFLHVQVADPLDRYERTREATEQGKADLEIVGKDTFGLLLRYFPPPLLQWLNQRKYRRRTANLPNVMPPCNISISNVPGPREILQASDNRISDLYSMGPLIDGVGINITVWSYAGNLYFAIMGCKQAMPDIRLITDGLQPALEELLSAAD